MSYFTLFQLDREPFSTSPDPSFFYRSTEHFTALNRLEISIRLKRGLCLILADVGIGKTTLSRALLQSFYGEEEEYIFHMILDPSFNTEDEFLAHLTKLFGVTPFFRSTGDYRDAIEKYLYKKCVDEQKTVVLLIDEGQKLSAPQMEILRTLLNYETNEYKMLQLVILGQLELFDRLKHIKNFMDRINLKYVIKPLSEFETQKMIEFRLQQAGYKGEKSLFSREAIQRIYTYTRGYPRQITRVCHKAVEHAIAENHEIINSQVIDRIIHQESTWS